MPMRICARRTLAVCLITILIVLFAPAVYAQVTAGFNASVLSGCPPLVVSFTNTTTPSTGTTYVWNMGNGTGPITLRDPATSYLASGTYTVTLTATNGSSVSSFSRVITVFPVPTVSFTASDTVTCPGAPVTFTNSTVGGVPGPVTYLWSSGDGFTSTVTNYIHPFSFSGLFNITLNATNANGCSSSLLKTGYVRTVVPPVASFTGSPLVICKHSGNVNFTSAPSGFGPFTYRWNFGDGTAVSTLANPTHFYATPGNYNVKLIVIDGHGCMDSMSRAGYVYISALTASFTGPTTACYNTVVNFPNTSTPHFTNDWTYGDGQSGTTYSGINTYSTRGTFNVRLIIADGYCRDTATRTVTIPSTVASFTITPANPCPAPVTATFAGTIPSGSTATWYYGDTTTGTGVNTTHTYNYSKFDTVKMVVTSSIGCRDTVYQNYRINDLQLNISAIPTSGCVPFNASFSAGVQTSVPPTPTPTPTPPYPYPYAVTYSWNFGDGSPAGSTSAPTHIYTAVGTYSVTCTVTSTNGCTKSTQIVVKTGTRAHATFTGTPTRLCYNNNIVTFTRTLISGTPDSYTWVFGDGGENGIFYDAIVTPTRSVTHRYTAPGTYSPMLVSYSSGCPDTFIQSGYVTIDPPKARAYKQVICSLDRTVQFRDSSTGGTSRLWIFDDGTTSPLDSPVHTFPSATIYRPQLTTYNSGTGCRDTQFLYVNLTPLRISVTAPDTAICRDQYVLINSTVISGFATSYRWLVPGNPNTVIGNSIVDTFHANGIYTIRLATVDSNGCRDTLTKIDFMHVSKPDIYFRASPSVACYPTPTVFTDSIICLTGTFITTRTWDYGDGDIASASGPTISHVYSNQGAYLTTEIAIDNEGCRDTLALAAAAVYRPRASFNTGTIHACTSTNVLFNNTSTPTPSTITNRWSLGDGFTSTAVSPTHYYAGAGSYTIKLVITDTHGCMDSATYPNYVIVTRPHAVFSMDDSVAVCPPLAVHFTNASTGGSSNFWDLGNGTFSVATNPSNIYSVPALDTILLTVTDIYNCKDTAIGHVKVFGYAGAFNTNTDSGCAPLSVFFNASLDVSIASSISWDFSDGIVTTGLSDTITHIYSLPGWFLPKMIISDHAGCSSSSQAIDTIKVDQLIAGFIASPNPACIRDAVTFTDTSRSFRSAITNRLWSYNGTTSTALSPTFSYTSTGTHTDTLKVTSAWGCSATTTRSIVAFAIPNINEGYDSALCIGGTTALRHVTPGGTWSSGSPAIATVGSTGIVTAMSAGVATLTYAVSGCYTTIRVTVNTSAPSITGTLRMCAGGSTTLSNTLAGGAWSSASPSIAIIGNTTGVVTGISAGTAVISYALGSCLATTTVTVDPGVSLISGPGSICVGTTSAYTNATAGGSWSSTNPSVASIGSSSGIASGVSAGTAVITYTLSGCSTTKGVTVNMPPGPITGVRSVCSGGTTTLSNTVSGGTWSSASPSVATVNSSGVVTGVSAGTATISYAVGSCLAFTTVTVNAGVSAISGLSGICVGINTIYVNSTTGGSWSSSNPSVASIGSATGEATGVAAGTAVITYTLLGCYTTLPITVDQPPATITGVMNICAGATTTLSNAVSGGSWNSGSPAIATINSSAVVSAVSVGTTVITYTVGGCTTTATVTVSPNPGAITGMPVICIGTTTTYSNTVGGGIWSSSDAAVATIGPTTGIVTGIAAGTATITYSISGCYATTLVTVNSSIAPAPITGTMALCLGDVSTLSSATSGGLWSSASPGIATIGSADGLVTAISGGTTAISYAIGSCVTTATVTVAPGSTGLPIAGPGSICVGVSTTYTNRVPGGTWGSSDPAIALVGPGSAVITGVVTGVAAGVATISYTVINACGTSLSVKTITVNPLAAAGTLSGPADVCIGSSATLTSLVAGGLWSTSSVLATVDGSTGLVTGVATGPALLSYTVSNMCGPVVATRMITVTPPPDAGSISGPSGVCAGAGITLTNSVASGTWSSGGASIAVVGSHSAIITGISAGVTVVSYTVTNSCGSSNVVKTITINPTPAAITGVANICIGASATYTSATTGGNWNSSTPLVAVVGAVSGVVSGVSAGSAVVTYTMAGGCRATKAVTVSAAPDAGVIIIDAGAYCIGNKFAIHHTGWSGRWSVSNGHVLLIGDSLTAVSAGIDTIYYTVTATCGTSVTTQTINVAPYPPPPYGSSVVCAGDTITLRDSLAGGTWTCGAPFASIYLPSGDTCKVIGKGEGVAVITYTMSSGCSSTTTVTVNPAPDAGTITGNSSLCAGARVLFSEDAYAGKWYSSNVAVATVDSITGFVTSISSGTTIITFVVRANKYGCDNKATFPLTVRPNTLKVNASVTNVTCYGGRDGAIAISMTGGNAPYEYDWSSGHRVSMADALGAGRYSVEVTETNTQCHKADTIEVGSPDSIALNASVTNEFCAEHKGSISINATGGTVPYTYAWNGAQAGSENTGLVEGVYNLVLTDMNGCRNERNFLIADSCINLKINTGFSPNGDGINDTWVIEGIEQYPNNSIQVFDKIGNKVFESNNYQNDWDGSDKPNGTYFYLVKLNSSNLLGGNDTFSGALLIKR